MKQIGLLILLFTLNSCSHVFYQPDNYQYSYPELNKVKHENIYFHSQDGTKLHAWKLFANTKNPKGTIVFFHGNAQNISAHFYQVWYLTNFGYQVFIADYRGYGNSQGEAARVGIFQDAQAILKEAYQWHLKSKTQKFIVYGQSLGGTISIPALSQMELKNSVDLLIIDSSFLSYRKIAKLKLKQWWISYPFSFFTNALVSDVYTAQDYLPDLSEVKLLVIHSEADWVVPIQFGEEIFQSHQGQKEFWRYKKHSHIGIFHYLKEREKMANYLEQL